MKPATDLPHPTCLNCGGKIHSTQSAEDIFLHCDTGSRLCHDGSVLKHNNVSVDQAAMQKIDDALKYLSDHKPLDRPPAIYPLGIGSRKSRSYSVTITEMEKAQAYFKMYVLGFA